MGKNFRNFFQSRIQLADGMDRAGIGRVELLRTGTFKHPKAPNGSFTITRDMLFHMKENFDSNARKLDKGEIAVDYGHKPHDIAAGWINEVSIEDNEDGINSALWTNIDYTEKAENAILAGEWRFISADIDFDFKDNETGVSLGPTLLGAGLINRPHIKAMQAIFNEHILTQEKPKEEFSMTPEEMLKKIGELEAAISMLKSQVSAGEGKFQQADKLAGDLEAEKSQFQEKLDEANAKIVTLNEEKETTVKEAKFNEYLAAGKVVDAQKETFMKLTLELAESLYKDASAVVNLGEAGHGTVKKVTTVDKGDEGKTAFDIIEERAVKLRETNTNLSLSESYSEVMSADKELGARYDEETNSIQA